VKRLSTRDLIEAGLQLIRQKGLEMVEVNHELQSRVKLFEAVVWFPHLQAVVNACDSRGMSGELRGMKVLTWCCAGRCLIQFEEGGATLTLITADDEGPWKRETAHVAPFMGPMGIQHVDGEYVDILKMIYKATRYGGEISLSPNSSVGI